MVTGAENNSVLKIWSCQSWACMQTITFAPSPKYPTLALKAGLDQSAKYLLLSDIHRRVLFILHFDNNNDDSSIYCKKISEFFLPSPILSFGIVDAGKFFALFFDIIYAIVEYKYVKKTNISF